MKETIEHNNRFYTNEKGEIKTENEQLKEWLIIANKEIKILKEEYVMLQNASDEVEEKLQQRIDKAIEHIEKVKDMYTINEVVNQAGMPILDISIEIWKKELLDILKGSDKE